MHIEFQPLSMMELRSQPGKILDRVGNEGKAFIVERNGMQLACLVPLWVLLPDIDQRRISEEVEKLQKLDAKPSVSFTQLNEIEIRFQGEGEDCATEVTILLPHGYPNKSPRVSASPIDDGAPHRWQDGSLCIFGVMSRWNPGIHDIPFTLGLARKWLKHYTQWKRSGNWPTGGEL